MVHSFFWGGRGAYYLLCIFYYGYETNLGLPMCINAQTVDILLYLGATFGCQLCPDLPFVILSDSLIFELCVYHVNLRSLQRGISSSMHLAFYLIRRKLYFKDRRGLS